MIFKQYRNISSGYPRQFWYLSWGMLISAIGGSMVWPFLTIYIRQRLGAPLTTVTLLLTLNSGIGLVTTFIAGPIADRLGRKGVMLASLLVSSMAFAAMNWGSTLLYWAVLISISGAFGPLFRVGSDAMVADLVEPDRRAEAYALLRMSNNLGIAIGPAVGGFMAAASYTIALFSASAVDIIFVLLILFFVAETLPKRQNIVLDAIPDSGYQHMLKDKLFLVFIGLYALAVIPASLVMVLLPVYAKEQFHIIESQYGFIMATNAAMVVIFQYAITKVTKRYPNLQMLVFGALFYALGAGTIALDHTFFSFILSMVIVTIGEMILVPTGTTFTANQAPPEMRGRYMGVFSLTWGISFGIGPVLGGYLNDNLAPVAIWYGGLLIGLLAMLGFILLRKVSQKSINRHSVISD
jgi:MFS family permease